jgi:hypothetical protein
MTAAATHDDHSAVGWYRELTPVEKRTSWACFGGWALGLHACRAGNLPAVHPLCYAASAPAREARQCGCELRVQKRHWNS